MSLELGGIESLYNKSSANEFDYYSGSQITVHFGDIFIDDINSIQYRRVQNKMPIYGYSSKNFDSMANGTVVIQGGFAINFRQRGYMSMVMEEIKGIYGEGDISEQQWPEVKRLIGLHLKQGTFGPQTADQLKQLGNSEDFEQVVQQYEQAIWGDSIPSESGSEQDITKITNLQPADVHQSEELSDGFNILITYGDPHSEPRTVNGYLSSTAKVLNGVHLTGESQVIQVGGQPCIEQYEFIARDTDKYVGTNR